jgi:apolipoprotein N-acyltransferase
MHGCAMMQQISSDQDNSAAGSLRPEIQRIISRGATTAVRRNGSPWVAAGLILTSLLLLWLAFTPVEFAPAAWLALVPLTILVRLNSLPRFCYLNLCALGFLWGLATLQWMRLGHPMMYGALIAMAFYLSLYFPAFVFLSRKVTAAGLPLVLAIPVVWTALELLRAYLLTGFSWYYLGHSQYRWLTLIQISDLTGAYGVSFVIAFFSAAVSLQIPASLLRGWNLDISDTTTSGLARIGVSVDRSAATTTQAAWFSRYQTLASAVLIVLGCCAYGAVRISPANRFTAGPAIALIQGNFSPEVKHDPANWTTSMDVHMTLTEHSHLLRPDIIVWPETMFPWPERSVTEGVTDQELIARLPSNEQNSLNVDSETITKTWRGKDVQSLLANQSQAAGAAFVMGLETHEVTKSSLLAFNSAAFVRPDIGYVGRYDKIHRVIFGEYIPLKDLFPWLGNLTPFGLNFGIAAGQGPKMYEYAGFQIAPLICFEDTVPHLVRKIASQKSDQGRECDLLVNLCNDAWFRGSSELDQHLITALFRCIETRTPMVRAVNGGVSAFIDGNGEVREPDQILMYDRNQGQQQQLQSVSGMRDPATGKWRRQFDGVVFGQIPLDQRSSLYLATGDWFALTCVLITAFFFIRSRFRETSNGGQTAVLIGTQQR